MVTCHLLSSTKESFIRLILYCSKMKEIENSSEFIIDMHVHSSRHSECAEALDAQRIEQYARKAQVNGVVITEHDTLWDKQEFQDLQANTLEVQFYNGVEVTTSSGCHLVVIGIDEIGPLHKGITSERAIAYVHEQGGVVILAHPFRKGLPPLKIIERVDAIEVGSTSLYENESKLSFNLADVLRKPAIASSDAHALPMIGWAYTVFPAKPENDQHLCRMIREGVGKPVLPNPFFG